MHIHSVVQSPNYVWLFETAWTAAYQASLFLTSPEVCPRSCPMHQWCHPTISSSDALFSFCPQSLPAPGIFPTCLLFTSDDQNTGVSASASVLPTSIQGWFPLRQGFPYGSVAKESACNAGDPGSIPGSGRSSGEGIGYPLQYSWASLWLSW